MVDSIVREVIFWVSITKDYKEYSLDNLLMDWCTMISTSGMRKSPMPSKWLPLKREFQS